MDAARHWAQGGVQDDTADDLAAFGATVEQLHALPDTDTDFGVFEENADAVVMFLKLQTQWNVSSTGVFLGLNYPAVESCFRIHSVADQPAMMNDLQIMELAALQILNKRES
jgi:hypothetical protein